MHVVEVIPLTRSAHVDTLTYYTSFSIAVGDIVDIPVRKHTVRGLVVHVAPLGGAKAAVKAATFTLRKLTPPKEHSTLPPLLIKTAETLEKSVPATSGAILYALLPADVRDGRALLLAHTAKNDNQEAANVSLLTARTEERYRIYKSRIRETLAHRGSVLFVVPSSAHLEPAVRTLTAGLRNRVIVLNQSQGVKTRTRAYDALNNTKSAYLIITTPQCAAIDRNDITTVIIENAGSPYYRMRRRPYLDVRDVLRAMATHAGWQLILGDILPRTEDEFHRRTEWFDTEDEVPDRYLFENSCIVSHFPHEVDPQAPFPLLTPDATKLLSTLKQKSTHVLLLAARRGIAPVVACRDCGNIFRCPDSGAPYSLLRVRGKDGEEKRLFYCSTSGRHERASDTCSSCGSWRLAERGIGIQNIESHLSEIFPHLPYTLFDHTTARTKHAARKLISSFFTSDGGVLLATPLVLPYLDTTVTQSVVTSYEALRAVPTWHADEFTLRTLFELRERTERQVIVQTRNQETDAVLDAAVHGRVRHFYDEQIDARRQLRYPPFSIFIHLTISGSNAARSKQKEEIETALPGVQIHFYPGAKGVGVSETTYGLIRVPAHAWPDTALIARLKTLPQSIRIEIDPYRIV